MATTGLMYGTAREEPDFDRAVIAMKLASCLLADKQYKLAAEMIGHAMAVAEPQSLVDILRRMYTDQMDSLHKAMRPFTMSGHYPIRDEGCNRGN